MIQAKEKIKRTIYNTIRKAKHGEGFYPSDFADKYGFDYLLTVEVMDEMTKEGKFM